jgi:MinD-like ATPase involved in chromosome partitioning or flagellar assembly
MTTTDITTTGDPAAPSAFAGARRASQYIEHPTAPPASAIETQAEPLSSDEAVADLAGFDAELPPVEVPAELDELDRDLGELAIAAPPRIAQKGLRGLAGKLGLKLAPGAAESAELARVDRLRRNEEIIRQATWTRAVSILVANPKGGVGKTPTALLLGGMLAAVRGGSVCIVEVSDDPGALTFRSEGRPPRGLGELVRDASDIRSAGQLAGYTAPQSSFASVIGSVGARARLDGDDVAAVATVIDDYFAIRVMDSGNQPSSSAFRAAVYNADVLVVPIFNAGDAALEAAALLDSLKASSDKGAELAARAIIVRLHDGRPENPQVVARVDRILASYGVTQIHDIPYDAHIAERGQISLGKLATPTHDAIAAEAADVVRTLQTTVR